MKKRKNIMKLSNGKKIIERNEQDYIKNQKTWELRGWKPINDKPKQDHKINYPKDEPEDKTYENETKVVQLKTKKKKKKVVKK